MGKLLQFWRQDIINKLIMLVGLVIFLTLGTLVYILVATSGGKTLIASFNPTPTLSIEEIFARGEQTATAEIGLTLSAVVPTITTLPFTPLAPEASRTPTSTPSLPQEATATPGLTETPAPSPTGTAAATSTPGTQPTAARPVSSTTCYPKKNPQVGKVLEIIDTATVRVLMNDLVYVVRYIGVQPPPDQINADLSRYTNAELVYAREITLYSDGADMDENSRLLRYAITAEGNLVNQDLIGRGLATALEGSYSCATDFLASEQAARMDKLGMWKPLQP